MITRLILYLPDILLIRWLISGRFWVRYYGTREEFDKVGCLIIPCILREKSYECREKVEVGRRHDLCCDLSAWWSTLYFQQYCILYNDFTVWQRYTHTNMKQISSGCSFFLLLQPMRTNPIDDNLACKHVGSFQRGRDFLQWCRYQIHTGMYFKFH